MRDFMEINKKQIAPGKKYKSPKWKLIRFFEKSRDTWKKKAKDAKYQIKLLRKKVKYLEENKLKDKEHTKNLELQLKKMSEKERKMQEEIPLD